MSPNLAVLKQPIGIRNEHICAEATSLRIRRKCSTWSRGNFIATNQTYSLDSSLFAMDGKKGSWSQRRAVRDSSGLSIFDMRRKNLGDEWFVELPGGSLEPMVTISSRLWEARGSWKTSDKYDIGITLQNWAVDGARVALEVRGLDVYKE